MAQYRRRLDVRIRGLTPPARHRIATPPPRACGSSCTSCRCRTGTDRCGRPSPCGCGSAPASCRSPPFVDRLPLRPRSPAAPRRGRVAPITHTDSWNASVSSMRKTVSVTLSSIASHIALNSFMPSRLYSVFGSILARSRTGRCPNAGGPSCTGGSSRPGRAGSAAGSAPSAASPAGSARRRRSTARRAPAPRVTSVSVASRRPPGPARPAPSRPAPWRPPPPTSSCR